MWLERKIKKIHENGDLNLSTERKVDLSLLKAPRFKSNINLIRKLNLFKTNVTSLEGLPKLPKLTELNIDYTKFSNFKDFKKLPNLRVISLRETPISKIKNFQVSLLILYGEGMTRIDGKLPKQSLQEKASTYPEVCKDLVNLGWMATEDVPEEDDLRIICNDYGFRITPNTPTKVESRAKPKESMILSGGNYLDVISELHKKHDEMLLRAQAAFGIVHEDDKGFTRQVVRILSQHGIGVKRDDDQAILAAVKLLISNYQRHNSD